MEPTTHRLSQAASRTLFRVALLFFAFAISIAHAREHLRFVPGQILVKPRAGVSESALSAKLGAHGAISRRTLHRLNVRVVTVAEENADAVLTALKNDPAIEFAERDYLAQAAFVPNDSYVANEWHLSKIQAFQAWDGTVGRSDVVVAVLDSGVNLNQPDLTGRILPGYDFVNATEAITDDFGHGTAVTGVIAANGNNGQGVAGVAYDCSVLPVKVMDASGFAPYSTIAAGIKYAVDNGARVINLSIAGSSPSETLQEAIDYAWSNNVVVVAAAGNNADSTPQYPAACNHVLSVSSTAPDDSLSYFSSFGSDVKISAPGETIWTTQSDLNNPYGPWRGTSFATPVVSAVAALVISANPTLSNDQVVSLLEQSADDIGAPGYDTSFGFGRVNALRAVSAASAAPGAVSRAPSGAPSVVLSSPGANAQFVLGTNISFLAVGAAGNAGGTITNITFTVNGVQLASGSTSPLSFNWTPSLAGEYVVTATATDDGGLTATSASVSFTVTSPVTTPPVAPAPPSTAMLVVQTSGLGTVLPNLNGAQLQVGKRYTLRAKAGAGQIFASWSGGALSSPSTSFVMQSNLVLTANFVPNPFPAVKGNYAGLAANSDVVTPENSGYFGLTIGASGVFSGKLMVGGGRFSFHGQFDLSGNAAVAVSRGKLSSPLRLTLHVDLSNSTDRVSGSLTDGAWVSSVSGDRNVFNSKLNPAAQAGMRNFVLERADNTTVEAGVGAGRISTSGAASVSGSLDDGTKFRTASLLAKNGDCPFYLSLSKGNEVVIGWLNFPKAENPTATGTVLWVRSGTNTFSAQLQAASAP
ncbi:MAG TPA: S8 family serine peptidase [Verrucomicrobiae bacterium]|nr:S8 family serine peptidase [Verrucomicrobiae bacterium]